MFVIIETYFLYVITNVTNMCTDLMTNLMSEMESSGMESKASYFTEDNFNEMLSEPECSNNSSSPTVNDDDINFNEIARYGIIDIIGDDSDGRKVIVVYACKLPPTDMINHDKFLE